jgi:hypothetical protein
MKKLLMIACAVFVVALVGGLLYWNSTKTQKVDLGMLTQPFVSAPATAKAEVDKAVASIREGKYAPALELLLALVEKEKLSKEQTKAIYDFALDVQKKASEKPGPDASKATELAQEIVMKIDSM